MPNVFQRILRIPRPVAAWLLGIIAVALIGGSLTIDMTGESAAAQYVLARWSFNGLRAYLWLEGLLLAGVVGAIGTHVVSSGLAVTRGTPSRLFGIHFALHPLVPRNTGYVFVVLGAALIALSLTMLVLLNSCVYMRLV